MTAPEDPNGLREAVARAEGNGRLLPQQIENGCTWENSSPLWQSRMRQEADRLLASPGGKILAARILAAEASAATLRADLERVTAERDAARVEGVLCWLKTYGKDTMADFTARVEAAEAENTRLTALLAGAVEALTALKAKADDQLAYWRTRMAAEKCLEDGVSEDGETYTPIGDEAAWQGGYCNGRLSEADWWRSTIKHDIAALSPNPKDSTHG